METIKQKLTAALGLAAEIPDPELQRSMLNAVLDLQDEWRKFAQGFIAKHRGLSTEASDHIEGLAIAVALDPLAGFGLEETSNV
jgi:hypothetical protein